MNINVYKVYSDFHTFARDVFTFTYGNDCEIKIFHSLRKARAEWLRLKSEGISVSPITVEWFTWDVKNGHENESERAALERFNIQVALTSL